MMRFAFNKDMPPFTSLCYSEHYGDRWRTSSVETVNQRQKCSKPGLAVEFIRELCRLVRLDCEIRLVPFRDWGDNRTGEWTGIIRNIMDDAYDAAMPAFEPTQARSAVVNFTRTVFIDDTFAYTRFPEPEKYSLGAIFGFSWIVWVMIVISIVAIASLGVAFERYSQLQHRAQVQQDLAAQNETTSSHQKYVVHNGNLTEQTKKNSTERMTVFGKRQFKWMMDIVSIFLQQGTTADHYHTGFLPMLCIWGLCCIVLTGSYSSFIVASTLAKIVRTPFEADFGSLADCVQRKGCRLVLPTLSTSHYEHILNDRLDDGLERLRETLKANPVQVHRSVLDRILDKSRREKDALYWVSMTSGLSVVRVVQNVEECSILVRKMRSSVLTIPIRLGNKHLVAINHGISYMREIGISPKIYNHYAGSTLQDLDKCFKSGMESKAYTVWNYVGIFFVYIIGCCFALLILGFEYLIHGQKASSKTQAMS